MAAAFKSVTRDQRVPIVEDTINLSTATKYFKSDIDHVTNQFMFVMAHVHIY